MRAVRPVNSRRIPIPRCAALVVYRGLFVLGCFSIQRAKPEDKIATMRDVQDVENCLVSLIRLIVDEPGEVAIETISGPVDTTYRVTVAKADIGKVIGKQGRTARSLRQILLAMSMTVNRRFKLDIVEEPKLG